MPLTREEQSILSLAKMRGIWDAAKANGLAGADLATRFTAMCEALRAGEYARANELADEMMGDHRRVAQEFVTEIMATAGVEVGW